MKFSRRHACLGMAALVYPYTSTRKYLELSTAAKVTAALIEEDTEYGSESEIEGFFQRLEITWEALCSRMEAQARVLAPSISFRDYAQPLLLQPDLWESTWQGQTVREVIDQLLQGYRRDYFIKFEQALVGQIDGELSKGVGGALRWASEMLANGHCREASNLLDLIGNRSAESEIPSESLKSKIEDREQNIAQLGPSISNLTRPWKRFKKSRVHAEVSNMLIALQGLIDLQKSEIVARNVQTIYQRIANDVQFEASRYRKLVDRLEGLTATLLSDAEASNPLGPHETELGTLDRIVLSSEVLAEMKTECSKQVPLIVGDLKDQDMTSWVELPENEILDAIVEAVRIRFP